MGKKKKKKQETRLTRTGTEGMEVPDWLVPSSEEGAAEGLENMRPGDLLVPRLVLLQGLSPKVVEGDNVAGQIINSITEEVWVDKEESKMFVPVYHYLEWIRWGDRETGEGILERSLDPDGKLAQMAMRIVTHTTSGGREVRTVTEYHNFVAIFPQIDAETAVIISCAKTNIKKGRKLLGLARYRGRYPLYAGQYLIKAVIETNAAGQKYYVYEFQNKGWVSEEDWPLMKKLYTILKDAYQQRKLLSHQFEEERSVGEDETEM